MLTAGLALGVVFAPRTTHAPSTSKPPKGGVFLVRACKLCRDAAGGIVVGGEYGG